MPMTLSGQQAVGGLVFGSMVCGTFGLGVWQTQRYTWKIELMEARKQALRAAAVQANGADASEKPLYQKLVLRGRYDTSKQVRVGPRSPPPGLFTKAQGLSSGPQGYEVITRFIAKDGTPCLVNRGWQPKEVSLDADAQDDEKEILVVRGEAQEKATFSPVNTLTNVLWIEVPFIASILNIPSDPIYLVAVNDNENETQWPRPRSPSQLLEVAVDPPTHLVYALTWFSLSIAGVFMTRRLLFPKPTVAATRRQMAAAAAAASKQSPSP